MIVDANTMFASIIMNQVCVSLTAATGAYRSDCRMPESMSYPDMKFAPRGLSWSRVSSLTSAGMADSRMAIKR